MIGLATPIPTLETGRLVLRAPAAADFEGFAAFWASDRSRHVGGPLDRTDAWRSLAIKAGHWSARGHGVWAVAWRDAPDRAVGAVGLWSPEGWPEPELTWAVWEEAEGKGVAAEAARAARDHAYGALGLASLVSYIAPENARSIRLAQRLGARPDAEAVRRHPEDIVYRHPVPEAAR